MERKKGIALNQAFGAVLVLILVATLVIIAIVLFVSLNTTFAGTATNSIVNESTLLVDAGVTLTGANNCSAADFVIAQALNATTLNEIGSGNYSVDTASGVLTNLTSAFPSELSAWLVTYSNTNGGAACTASEEMITQFGTYPVLIGLVGTIIFLGLVIGVLVASFVFGGRRA